MVNLEKKCIRYLFTKIKTVPPTLQLLEEILEVEIYQHKNLNVIGFIHGTSFTQRQAMITICVGGIEKIARNLSWSNHNGRSQISRAEDHEQADEGDIQG